MGLVSFDLSMGFAVGGLGLWGLGFRNQGYIRFRGLGLGFWAWGLQTASYGCPSGIVACTKDLEKLNVVSINSGPNTDSNLGLRS